MAKFRILNFLSEQKTKPNNMHPYVLLMRIIRRTVHQKLGFKVENLSEREYPPVTLKIDADNTLDSVI